MWGERRGVLTSIVDGHVPRLLIEGVSVGRKAGSADINGGRTSY